MSFLAQLFGPRAEGGGLNPLDDRLYTSYGAGTVALTGERVTTEKALSVAAMFRGVSILANTFGALPLGIYERMQPRGRREVPDHPLDFTLCRQPNARQTPFEWKRMLLACLVLRGDSFNQIAEDEQGRRMLVPLDPDKVTGPEVMPSGRVRFWFDPGNGQPRVPLIEGLDLWHLMGLSLDGKRGCSIIEYAANTIGIARAAESFAALFFDRGVTFKGILEHPKTLKSETARDMSANFTAAYGGYAGAHRTPVLWEGMQFKPLSMTLKDAEYMESRKFGVSEIARLLGLPPHMLGDVERSTSWGTGIEEQRSEMTTFTMLPWCRLFEESVQRWLMLEAEAARYYVRFNLNALLRAKTKERYDVYAIGIDRGILSPNDCRELEEMNPREGGDDYKDINAAPALGAAPPAGPGNGGEDPEDEDKPDAPEPEDARRAVALARFAASEVIRREADALVDAAGANAAAGAWRQFVATFYGRHAAFVEGALGVTKDAARDYCRRQQKKLTEQGAAALTKLGTDGHRDELVALALGG